MRSTCYARRESRTGTSVTRLIRERSADRLPWLLRTRAGGRPYGCAGTNPFAGGVAVGPDGAAAVLRRLLRGAIRRMIGGVSGTGNAGRLGRSWGAYSVSARLGEVLGLHPGEQVIVRPVRPPSGLLPGLFRRRLVACLPPAHVAAVDAGPAPAGRAGERRPAHRA